MLRRSAAVLAVTLGVAAGAAACGDDDDATPTTTEAPATTTTTTTAPAGTTVTTAATTTQPPGTTQPAGPAVSVLDAGPSAGSGEIQLTWEGVAGAVAYRVERADAPAGPFEASATIDVATGATTEGDGVVYVALPMGGQPFTYIEFGDAPRRYLRVVAVHPGGDAEPSPVVCGALTGLPDC